MSCKPSTASHTAGTNFFRVEIHWPSVDGWCYKATRPSVCLHRENEMSCGLCRRASPVLSLADAKCFSTALCGLVSAQYLQKSGRRAAKWDAGGVALARARVKRFLLTWLVGLPDVGTAMALTEKAAELKQYLRNANLPEEFASHCLRALKMRSLQDFVSYVSSTNYEAELKTRVVDTCAATKGKPLILARVRSAWRSARASLQGSAFVYHESIDIARRTSRGVVPSPHSLMATSWYPSG